MIVIEREPFLGQSGTLFFWGWGGRQPNIYSTAIVRTKIKYKFEIQRFIFENRKINDVKTSLKKKPFTEKEENSKFCRYEWVGREIEGNSMLGSENLQKYDNF